MPVLAELVDDVIGLDSHRDPLAAAAISSVGGVLAQTVVGTDAAGYQALLGFADAHLAGRRCWAIEGAGSYGAGLAAVLRGHGEQLVEAGRPKRPPRRTGAKTDAIDAVRAARDALGQPPQQLPAVGQRSDHQALGVLLTPGARPWPLGSLRSTSSRHSWVSAPEELRTELRGLPTKRQVAVGAALRTGRPNPWNIA
jgi:transposase